MRMLIAMVILTSWSAMASVANLESVETYFKDGAFFAEVRFDKNIPKESLSVDYINSTIQINISNANLSKEKISTTIAQKNIRSLYTYNTSENSSRIRVIYNNGIKARDYENLTELTSNGNKVLIKIFNSKESMVRSAQKVAETKQESLAKDEVYTEEDLKAATTWIEEKTKVNLDQATVAEKVKDSTKESAKEETKAVEVNQTASVDLNKNESEIPVLTEAKAQIKELKPVSSLRLVGSLALVFSILFGCYLFLKRTLKRSPLKKNSQIKVLTQHYLGPKKSLAIIRVAGESILIGVTDQNINLIKTLALLDEEIPQDLPNKFSNSLNSALSDEDQENDEFSFSKIKDFVSDKLKDMKEI